MAPARPSARRLLLVGSIIATVSWLATAGSEGAVAAEGDSVSADASCGAPDWSGAGFAQMNEDKERKYFMYASRETTPA
jgi:hypothetical protein